MSKMLGASVHWVIWPAATVVDVDKVSTRYVKDHETSWARGGAWARSSVVSELNA